MAASLVAAVVLRALTSVKTPQQVVEPGGLRTFGSATRHSRPPQRGHASTSTPKRSPHQLGPLISHLPGIAPRHMGRRQAAPMFDLLQRLQRGTSPEPPPALHAARGASTPQ